jgi:hypothetical protein
MVRNNVSGSLQDVRWAPTNYVSYDNGATWTSQLSRTFKWIPGQQNMPVKVRIRDRSGCVSDSTLIDVLLNNPVDPATTPVIATKATLPLGICSIARLKLESANVGDNLTYTWRVKPDTSGASGGSIFDTETGGSLVTTGATVFNEKYIYNA